MCWRMEEGDWGLAVAVNGQFFHRFENVTDGEHTVDGCFCFLQILSHLKSADFFK